MNQLQVFNHEIFGSLEILRIDSREFFPATDVAMRLGYSNPNKAVRDHCREKGCTFRSVLTNGGNQNKRFIDEGNLYRLITNSKLPDAEKFESWVFDEVLPSIRKHEAYMTPNKIEEVLLNPDMIITLATQLKEELALRQEERSKRLAAEETIELQRPKVVYAEAVTVSEDTVLVKDLATVLKQKGIDIGHVRLFEWLRENSYLCKQKGEMWNMPTQRSLDLGVIVVRHGLRTGTDGEMRKTRTPKITGKGQIYFINKFLAAEQAI